MCTQLCNVSHQLRKNDSAGSSVVFTQYSLKDVAFVTVVPLFKEADSLLLLVVAFHLYVRNITSADVWPTKDRGSGT